jgi:hypothetical protein
MLARSASASGDAPKASEAPHAPAFIACGARSGSTLLRWLIDSHPQVACPGESDIALMLERHLRTATVLATTPVAGGETAVQRARAAADSLIDGYLSGAGKTHLCEKSLSNALHLELLASAWPEARFILLHRSPMDFVISALEASPWGLSGYGFGEFAQKSPTDDVVALIAYWLDRTRRLLAFEERLPERCLRVRYEDLVTETDAVLDRVWALIGVPAPSERDPSSAFGTPREPQGAADHKVWYTDEVHERSLGRGARVPPQLVSGIVRTSVNELAARLGYPAVDDHWGSGGPAPQTGREAGDTASEDLIELRILEGQTVHWRGHVDLATLVLETSASGAPARIVVVEREALAAIAEGSENLGAALRARTLRSYGPPIAHYGEERELFQRLQAFLADAVAELLGAPEALAL